MSTNKGRFALGNKAGQGRPPLILPEVQKVVDQNRNAVKILILQLLGMNEREYEAHSRKEHSKMERLFIQCIDKIEIEGDIDRLRKLLEVTLGKLPEAPEPMELSPDEKHLVMSFRQRLEQAKNE